MYENYIRKCLRIVNSTKEHWIIQYVFRVTPALSKHTFVRASIMPDAMNFEALDWIQVIHEAAV